MTRTAFLGMVAAMFLAALLAVAARASPATAETPVPLDQRGEYLATLAGCGRCHTPGGASGQADETRQMAGGVPFLTQSGTVFSANLTPDPETGLGYWSDQQMQRAIRLGLSPGKGRLSPVMPYLTYQGMADMDVHAVVAYLRQLPAVSNEVPVGDGQGYHWQGLTRVPYRQATPSRMPSSPVARGRYLVHAVAGCAECHSPRTPDGFPDPARYLEGAETLVAPGVTSTAPSITQDQVGGIGAWSDEEIGNAITGTRPDGSPMDSVMHVHYLSGIEAGDLSAVVAYLRTVQPGTNPIQEDRRPPRREAVDLGQPNRASEEPIAAAPLPTAAAPAAPSAPSSPASRTVGVLLLLGGIGVAAAIVVLVLGRRRGA